MNGSKSKRIRRWCRDNLRDKDTTIQANKYQEIGKSQVVANYGRRFYQLIKREN